MEYLDEINKTFKGKTFKKLRAIGRDKAKPDSLIFYFSDGSSFSIKGRAVKTSIEIDSLMTIEREGK